MPELQPEELPLTALDQNSLFQQMGEVARGLRALYETIELRHAQVDKLHDLLRADISVLRQDQRDLDEKLDCVICVVQHDIEGLRTDSVSSHRSIDELLRAVQEIRQPVAEILALRSRVAGLLLGLSVLGSVAMWLAEPVYRWFVEHNYLRQ